MMEMSQLNCPGPIMVPSPEFTKPVPPPHPKQPPSTAPPMQPGAVNAAPLIQPGFAAQPATTIPSRHLVLPEVARGTVDLQFPKESHLPGDARLALTEATPGSAPP